MDCLYGYNHAKIDARNSIMVDCPDQLADNTLMKITNVHIASTIKALARLEADDMTVN